MDPGGAFHPPEAAKRSRGSPEWGQDADEGEEWLARPYSIADLSTACSASPLSMAASTVGDDQHRPSLDGLVPVERPPRGGGGGGLAAWLRSWWLPRCRAARLAEPPERSILGEGAFARVIRARSRSGDCAVKQLERGRPEIVRRECEIALRISGVQYPHPCIAQVFFVVPPADRARAAVVMELCDGPSLSAWIKERRARYLRRGTQYELSQEAQCWFGQIFLAMEFLHRKLNIVHRDLKPENVVLHNHRVAKLVDYGVGRYGLESDGNYSLGGPPGTLGYKAPELIAGKPYDHRVDFYSLGVLLWVLQTGGAASSGDDDLAPPRGGVRDAHELLLEHLKDPASYGLPELPADGKRLVKKLTRWSDSDDRSFERRGTHDEVRKYPFLAQLNMPAWSASTEEVKDWLARRPRTSRFTCCLTGEP